MARRILWIGDSPTLDTGYGRATREILKGLTERHYSPTCLGRAFDGWPYDASRFPYPIIPTGADYVGSQAIQRAIAEVRPDCIVAFGDIWMVDWIHDIPERKDLFVVGYIPIDGGPLPLSWRGRFRSFDKLVTCSHFGKEQLANLLPDRQVDVVYLGVDLSVFKALPNREQLRGSNGIGDEFVVGCVARNQRRKQIPTLIQAFCAFHDEQPNSLLYLHTSQEPNGWVLEDFISHYGLNDAVRLTPNILGGRGVPDHALNVLYNLFDVMVLPTAGEGFGLPILEAMAASVPVLATEFSACVELVEGRGELIAKKADVYLGPQIVKNVLVDPEDLSSKLRKLHFDPELMHKHQESGLKFASSLGWQTIVEQWDALFRSIR